MHRLALCLLALFCGLAVGCVRFATPAYAYAPAAKPNTRIYNCVNETLNRLGWHWNGVETRTILPGTRFTLCRKRIAIRKGSNLWRAAGTVLGIPTIAPRATRPTPAPIRTAIRPVPYPTVTTEHAEVTSLRAQVAKLEEDLTNARRATTKAQEEATTANQKVVDANRQISDLQAELTSLKSANPLVVVKKESYFSPWGWLLLFLTLGLLGATALLLLLFDKTRKERTRVIREREESIAALRERDENLRVATEERVQQEAALQALEHHVALLERDKADLERQYRRAAAAAQAAELTVPLEVWVNIEPSSRRHGSSVAPILMRITDAGRHDAHVRVEPVRELRIPLWGFAPWALNSQTNLYEGDPIKIGQIVLTPTDSRIEYETAGLTRALGRSSDPNTREAQWLGENGYDIDTGKPIRVSVSATPVATAEPIPAAA